MSGPWERYQKAPEAGPWAKYAANAPAEAPPRDEAAERSAMFKRELLTSPPMAMLRGVKDVVDTGALGLATLYDKVTGADAPTLSSLVTGQPQGEAARVRAMNAAGRAEFDANAEGRLMPQLGRLGGNLAVVAPAVTALGAGVGTVLPRLGSAIRTGGMTTGAAPASAVARTADMGIRVAGGAAGGGLAAGMVNPEDAGTGAVIGALAPPVVQGLGRVGQAVGATLRGPAQSPQLAKAVADARQAGYVIPPTQARPTLGNRLMEGFAGKLTTAQNASARNQAVTNRLAAEALGLPGDTRITQDALNQLRAEAGQRYRAIATLGDMTSDARFANQLAGLKGAYEGAAKDFPGLAKPELSTLLDSLKSPTFKASSAVDAVRLLRESADQAFSGGNKGTAKALRSAASAMEDLIERNLLRINARNSLDAALRSGGSTDDIVRAGLKNNASQMLQDFRDARQLIAKTYTVEKALNPASGSIDARKLAAEIKRGKPLTGQLKQAGDFAGQFPKAAQPLEGMGSLPQSSPLDWHAMGATSLATGNPLPMLGVGARPAVRAAVLSNRVQNQLVQPPPSAMANALMNPEIQRLFLRSAPLAGSDR